MQTLQQHPSHPRIALLGGSFNPPHMGHFRMAMEVRESLRPEKVLFIPCARPLHKPSSNLLPFALRAAMLEAVLGTMPGMEVCRLEGERPGPSYTVDTLQELSRLYPGKRLVFILGGGDFPHLPSWNRWQRLPELADLLVLPRDRDGKTLFSKTVKDLWPEAAPLPTPFTGPDPAYVLPGGGQLLYLSQPRLEVSSSLLRRRWLEGRDLNFLIPEKVSLLLEANRSLATDIWHNERSVPPKPQS